MNEQIIKLDIGCGKHKQQGFIGIDVIPFDEVDIVMNAGKEKFPFEDNSVDEIHTSHFLEHLTAMERVHFVNEAFRVLKKGGKCGIIVPHWASCRAYGDMTHQWPPVSEFWFYYLDKDWRAVNAPHNDFYTCDFTVTWGYSLRQDILARSQEYQQFAIQNYKEVLSDTVATLIKK